MRDATSASNGGTPRTSANHEQTAKHDERGALKLPVPGDTDHPDNCAGSEKEVVETLVEHRERQRLDVGVGNAKVVYANGRRNNTLSSTKKYTCSRAARLANTSEIVGIRPC